MNRRTFIKNSSIVGTGMSFSILNFHSENKIKIGIVGVGWWGSEMLLPLFTQTGQFDIVAICDVNEIAINTTLEACKKLNIAAPQVFKDYKALYNYPNLEAVVIATPTYWHALMFIDACKKGLHIYQEKPVCYDIAEGKAMLSANKKAGNVVQVGFKSLNSPHINEVKSLISSGEMGKINQVIGNLTFGDGGGVTEQPIPNTIDWELYCGPVAIQKYMMPNGAKLPSWKSRKAMDHGSHFDWGIHYFNNARRILNLDIPNSVSAFGGNIKANGIETPDFITINWDFDGLPVQFNTRMWGSNEPMADNTVGVYIYGEKATVFVGEFGWEMYPIGNKAKISHGEVGFKPWTPEFNQLMPANISKLITGFADAIRSKSNKNIIAPFEDSFKATAAMIYADMAYKTKSFLEIDKATMGIKNNLVAREMLKREYRKPYLHPAG